MRGEKNGLPVTDGIFPESKEFLLGYWIVDVATPNALTPSRAGFRQRPDREVFRLTSRSRCGRSRLAPAPRTDPATNGNRDTEGAVRSHLGKHSKKEPKKMKYILMMNGNRSDFEGYAQWSKKDLRPMLPSCARSARS